LRIAKAFGATLAAYSHPSLHRPTICEIPIDPAAVQATLLQQMGWRTRPGIQGHHAASPQSIHALLGYFLNDRDSPTPFPGRDIQRADRRSWR
jgi:hypothetical protein